MWLEAQDGNNIVKANNVFIKKSTRSGYYHIYNRTTDLGYFEEKLIAEAVLKEIKKRIVDYELLKIDPDIPIQFCREDILKSKVIYKIPKTDKGDINERISALNELFE